MENERMLKYYEKKNCFNEVISKKYYLFNRSWINPTFQELTGLEHVLKEGAKVLPCIYCYLKSLDIAIETNNVPFIEVPKIYLESMLVYYYHFEKNKARVTLKKWLKILVETGLIKTKRIWFGKNIKIKIYNGKLRSYIDKYRKDEEPIKFDF